MGLEPLSLALHVEAVNLRSEVKRIHKSLSGLSAEVDIKADNSSLKSLVNSLSNASKDGFSKGMNSSLPGVVKSLEGSLGKGLSSAFGKASGDIEKLFDKAAIKGAKSFSERIVDGAEKASKVFDGMVGTLRGALSGGLSPENLVGGFSKAFKKMGAGMSKKGAGISALGDAKGLSKITKVMGTMMTKLGPMVSIMGSLAGGLVNIVGLLAQADAQAKGFNKQILSGGTSVNDINTKVGGLSDSLQSIRDSALDFSYNMRLGLKADEIIAVQKAFNDMGYTFKEIMDGANSGAEATARLQSATEKAVVVSRQLGLEQTESATEIARLMEQTGGGLDYVAERLIAVSQAAQMAGFGTKRFYGIMQNATAGIQMYNVRIEEAAGLLLTMSKILGADAAGQLLQQFGKGFSQESYTDKLKRVLVTGTDVTADILQNTIEDTARGFRSKVGDEKMGLTQGLIDKAVGGGKVDISGFGKGDEKADMKVMKEIAALSKKDQNMMVAQIREKDADLAIQFSKLVTLSAGSDGSATGQAEAISAMDMGGELAMKLAHAEKVLGKNAAEMSKLDYAAYESITGDQGGGELVKLAKGFKGNFDMLQSQGAERAGEYEGKSQEEIEKSQLNQIQQFGAYVNEAGKMVTASTSMGADGSLQFEKDGDGNKVEKEIENLNDYLQAQGDTLTMAMEEPMNRAEAMSQSIVDNTLDISTILEMGIQSVMENIYGVMKSIATMMTAVLSLIPGVGDNIIKAEAEKEEKRMNVVEGLNADLANVVKERKEKERKKKKLTEKMAQATPEEKMEMMGEMNSLDVDIKMAKNKEEKIRNNRKGAQREKRTARLDSYSQWEEGNGKFKAYQQAALGDDLSGGGILDEKQVKEFKDTLAQNSGSRFTVGDLSNQLDKEIASASNKGDSDKVKKLEEKKLSLEKSAKDLGLGAGDFVLNQGMTSSDFENGKTSLESELNKAANTGGSYDSSLKKDIDSMGRAAGSQKVQMSYHASKALTGDGQYAAVSPDTMLKDLKEAGPNSANLGDSLLGASATALSSNMTSSGINDLSEEEKATLGVYEGSQAILLDQYESQIEENKEMAKREGWTQKHLTEVAKETDKKHKESLKTLEEQFSESDQRLLKDRQVEMKNAFIEAEKESQMQALLQSLGEGGKIDEYRDDNGDLLAGEELMQRINQRTGRNISSTSEEGSALLTNFGAAFADSGASSGRVAHDFIYRSNGDVQYIDSSDDVIGAKMGGAFDLFGQKIKSASGSLSPSSNQNASSKDASNTSISFVIQETDNPGKTAQTVKRMLTEVGLI